MSIEGCIVCVCVLWRATQHPGGGRLWVVCGGQFQMKHKQAALSSPPLSFSLSLSLASLWMGRSPSSQRSTSAGRTNLSLSCAV